MKYLKSALFLSLLVLSAQAYAQRFWVATSSSNWNNTANWSTTSGGAGGASVPGPTDAVTFNALRLGGCTLDVAPTVAGISIASGYTGTINLNGFTLTTTGATNTFAGGTISNSGAAASLALNTTGSTTFSGTLFNADLTGTSGRLLFNGSTFNNPVNVTKSGATLDNCTGGDTFGSTVYITNSSVGGELNMANTNPDIFNSSTQLDITGSGRIQIGINAAGNIFNGTLTINHIGTTTAFNTIIARNPSSSATINGNLILNCANSDTASGIIISNEGTVVINGNITVSSSNGGRGVLFSNVGGSVTLSNGFTISDAGPGTFVNGVLSLKRFTQTGTTAQTIALSNTASLYLGDASAFGGNVDFRAPQLFLDGATYAGTTYLEKKGATDNTGNGNNVFNGTTTLKNTGSGNLRTNGSNTFNGTTLIQDTGSGDISLEDTFGSTYNGPVEFNNAGSTLIRVARTGNTLFNHNITVNSSSGTGIYFCETTTGTSATLAATRTITTTGFSAGDLRLQRFTQTGSTNQSMTFVYPGTGLMRLGPSTTFGGNVTFSAPRILLYGATYQGTASLQKTGAIGDDGTGGNVFNGAATIINSGFNYLLTGSTSPDTFNADLTVTNNGANSIRLADNAANNLFNGNIILNSTSGGGIFFGNTNGTSVLANDKTITTGSVITGDIRLARFTQTSSVNPQVLDLGGIAILTLGPASAFGGDVNFKAPQLFLNGVTLGTSALNVIQLEKKGAVDNSGLAGNVFNGTTTITDSGSGYLRIGNVDPETFNGNLTVTNTGTNTIYLSHTAAGNQYNGNITFNSTLGAGGIQFGGNLGTSTLASGASLSIGASGFVTGELRLAKFTQVGSGALTLLLTAPAPGTARLRLGPDSHFNGTVDFRAPRIALDGAEFNGLTYIEKTGATDDYSAGGNIFNAASATLANSGSGWFINATSTLDTFNGDLTLTNTGSAGLRMADNIPGTIFQGNIMVNSTFGSGIYFCENSVTATAQLAPGKTISVGGMGFTTGDLRIRRFTQLSTTNQTVALTGTATLRLGPTTIFNAATVDYRAPQLYLNGTTFNGIAILEKTGATDNLATGNNIFTSATSIKNSGGGMLRTNGNNQYNTVGGTTTFTATGAGDILLEYVTGSVYNRDIEAINTGSSIIRLAYNGTNSFLGNILVNSSAGTGISIGENAAAAATLASGLTLSVGTSPGFTGGELNIQHLTQTGTGTPHTLTLTGTSSSLRFGPGAIFNSNITTSSPRLYFDGGTFNGVNSFTKTSAGNDDSAGGNSFVGITTITNNGTGRLRLAAVADTFTTNVSFVRGGSGALEPAYNGINNFFGNITVSSAAAISFGNGTGIVLLSGGNSQIISKAVSTASPVIQRLTINKSANGLTLNTDVIIGTTATITTGVITSTATNFLNFANGATVTGASAVSYVNGPVRKTGTDVFTFPVGKNGIYRPIAMGLRISGTATDQYSAEYFNTVQTSGTTIGPGLVAVSACEYWTLNRTNGTASISAVTLSWVNADCPNTYVVNTADLRVANYNTGTSRWEDRGNASVTGTAAAGTITSSATISVFGAFALGTSTSSNPLPIELVSFTATPQSNAILLRWSTLSELNNDHFTLQRSGDGKEFASIATLKGAGTSRQVLNYQHLDENPLPGISYYRLEQVDFDLKTSFSDVVKVSLTESRELVVFPNPARGGSISINMKGNYFIYNNLGQLLMKSENTDKVDVSSLLPGIYTIKSETGQFQRLIVE